MDVINREKREQELQAALMEVWNEWTDLSTPEDLKQEDLERLLIERCLDPMWAVWIRAHGELADEMRTEDDKSAAAAAFMLFMRRWTDDLSNRWNDRVQGFIAKPKERSESPTRKPKPDAAPTPRDEPTGQEPAQEPVSETSGEPGYPPGARSGEFRPSVSARGESPSEQVDWKTQGRFEAFTEEDAEMTAVTAVTMTHSISEEITVGLIEESSETIVIGIYRTEPRACTGCSKYEGKEVFGPDGPNKMPPLHPNCRCWVEHVAR